MENTFAKDGTDLISTSSLQILSVWETRHRKTKKKVEEDNIRG
jgi:hypothetical protein